MGRRRHQPDAFRRRQVEAMAGYGIPEADIARVLGIDAKTLRKHYRDELDTGHVKANAKVAEFLYRKATTEGSQAVTAAIFWLKTRAGWKETAVHEMNGVVLNVITGVPRNDREGPTVIDHQPARQTNGALPPPSARGSG